MYQFIPLERDYLCQILLNANVAILEGKDRNETWKLNKEVKLELVHNVGSESDLNLWRDSSVG